MDYGEWREALALRAAQAGVADAKRSAESEAKRGNGKRGEATRREFDIRQFAYAHPARCFATIFTAPRLYHLPATCPPPPAPSQLDYPKLASAAAAHHFYAAPV